jgi:DoxX-like family
VKTVLRASLEMARVVLAMAFGFFGFMKATLPMAELARHGAWVAHLSPAIARAVGVSEMVCAIAISPLVSWRHVSIVRASAMLLLLNQCAAISMHLLNGQPGALALNALWCALAFWILAVYWIVQPPARNGSVASPRRT